MEVEIMIDKFSKYIDFLFILKDNYNFLFFCDYI